MASDPSAESAVKVLDISVQGNTIVISGKHSGGSGVKSLVCALCLTILGQDHRTHFIPVSGGGSLCFIHSLKVKIKGNLPLHSSASQLKPLISGSASTPNSLSLI